MNKKILAIAIALIFFIGMAAGAILTPKEPSLNNTAGTVDAPKEDVDLIAAEYGDLKTSDAYWDKRVGEWKVVIFQEDGNKLTAYYLNGDSTATQEQINAEIDRVVSSWAKDEAERLRKVAPSPVDKTGRNYAIAK